MRSLLLVAILLLATSLSGCVEPVADGNSTGTDEVEAPDIEPEQNDTIEETQEPSPEPEPNTEPEDESDEERDWSKECLSDHSGLAMHIHPTLVIRIENDSYIVGANTGIDTEICPDAMHVVHTHDDSGKLHVETPEPANITLSVFFDIWGVEFNSTRIMSFHVNQTHELVFEVDGEQSQDFENHIFSDGENILIHYRERA